MTDEQIMRIVRAAQLEAEQARDELAQFPPDMQRSIRLWLRSTLSPLAQAWWDAVS